MPRFLGSEVFSQILDAGFNFDFIDADAIDNVGIPYKMLILPGVDRIPPKSYEKIIEFARHGGVVVATRREPSTVPGYRDAGEISSRIQTLSQALFHGNITTAHFVADEHKLGESLASWLHPDFEAAPRTPGIGFIHRHLEGGDLYFVANTGNRPQSIDASFRSAAEHAELWDPLNGDVTGVTDPTKIRFDLQPYESRIVFFSGKRLAPAREQNRTPGKRIDISHDWHVTFASSRQSIDMADLDSWTEKPPLRYYSGAADYRKTIDISDADLSARQSIQLDFGEGTPVPIPAPLPHNNMRAYLESPVREAGQVFVNERLAGYVWHPPFRVDITAFLKAGKNDLRIVVGNTAINELSGESRPTYRLLYDRFGVEFVPQDIQGLEPLPSGLRGPITLIMSGGVQ
jgi:hypothetical protein